MSLRFQRLFLTFPEGLHSVPELSPKGTFRVQFDMLGFVVPVNAQLFRTQQMHVTNTPYIYIHTHLVLHSFLFCYTKFFCRTLLWLILDWTLSWQVGRKLKIILSSGFKWSGRWHARAHFDGGSLECAGLQMPSTEAFPELFMSYLCLLYALNCILYNNQHFHTTHTTWMHCLYVVSCLYPWQGVITKWMSNE